MNYFFLVIDYGLVLLLLLAKPWFYRIARAPINATSGLRTSRTMKSEKHWKKANEKAGDLCFVWGWVFLIFVMKVRYLLGPILGEWTSVLLSALWILIVLGISLYVNHSLKD